MAAPCVGLIGHLDSLRTLATWTLNLHRPTQPMSRQGEQPESRLVRQQPKRTRYRCSIEHHPIDSQNFAIFVHKLTGQFGAFHPRFAGQHDKLDEQFDKPTGWMYAYCCPTGQYGTPTTRTIGTNCRNAGSKSTIPGQRSSSIPAGSNDSPRSSIGTCQVILRYIM